MNGTFTVFLSRKHKCVLLILKGSNCLVLLKITSLKFDESIFKEKQIVCDFLKLFAYSLKIHIFLLILL